VATSITSATEGTGHIFARHLQRVYFEDKTYHKLGPPVLIVNTTDLKSDERYVFSSSWKEDTSAVPPNVPDCATAAGAGGGSWAR
jgi:hypothetical protein